MIVRVLLLWWLVTLLPTGTQTQCADGEIRLGGIKENEVGNWTEGTVDGRVELCTSNLTWRVLCEPEGGWKPEDAAVVCRQLGHSPLGAQGYFTAPLDFNSTSQVDNSTALLDNSTALFDNSTSQLDNSTAQVDNSTALLDNSTTLLDNSTTLLDNSTAQVDNSTITLDNFAGPFPDCSGRESRLSECPERNFSNNTSECLSTNVICQSPGTPDVKEMCVVVNGSAVDLTETVTSFIASRVQQMCMCAFSTVDLNTTTLHQCNNHVIFRILLNYNKALEKTLQFLQRRLSSVGLRTGELTITAHDCTTGCLTGLQSSPGPTQSLTGKMELTTISLPLPTTVLILTPSTVISTSMLPHMSLSEVYSAVTTNTPVAHHPNPGTTESAAVTIGGVTAGVIGLILTLVIMCVLLVGIWLKRNRKIASAKVTITCNHKQQERRGSNPYEEIHYRDPEHTLVNPLYYNSASFYSQSELMDTSDLRSQGSASYLVLNAYQPETTDSQSSVSEVRETRKHSYEEVRPYLELPEMYDQPQQKQHVNPYRISRPYIQESPDSTDQVQPSLDSPEANTQDQAERPRSRVNPYHISKPFLEVSSPESTQKLHLNVNLYKDEQGYSSLENLPAPPYATLEPIVGTMSNDQFDEHGHSSLENLPAPPYATLEPIVGTMSNDQFDEHGHSSLENLSAPPYATLEPLVGTTPNDQIYFDEHGYSSLENLSTSPYATLEPLAGNMPSDESYFDDDYSHLSFT